MADRTPPVLERQPPKPMVFIASLIYYLLFVPFDWILKKIFGKPGLLNLMMGRGRKKMQERMEGAFTGYSPTAHDVLVCNYSKSGTNWLLQMAYQLAFLGEGEFKNIHDVVAWPDFPALNPRRMILPLDDRIIQETSPTHLRVIKSHLSAQHVPYNEQAHYISVIRDPKDIFVSSYYFGYGMYGRIMPGMEDWLDAFLSDNFPLGFGVSWAEHTAGYWAWHDRPNVLILSFKEMKKDLSGVVGQVKNFLGIDLTEAQFDKVVEKCSFDYMKAIDEQFLPLKKNAFPFMSATMVRSGKEGNSRELLSEAQQQRIDDYFIAQLKELGSDLPYSDFCRQAQGRSSHSQSWYRSPGSNP